MSHVSCTVSASAMTSQPLVPEHHTAASAPVGRVDRGWELRVELLCYTFPQVGLLPGVTPSSPSSAGNKPIWSSSHGSYRAPGHFGPIIQGFFAEKCSVFSVILKRNTTFRCSPV